jgi:hypothetical protein
MPQAGSQPARHTYKRRKIGYHRRPYYHLRAPRHNDGIWLAQIKQLRQRFFALRKVIPTRRMRQQNLCPGLEGISTCFSLRTKRIALSG